MPRGSLTLCFGPAYRALIDNATKLNTPGIALGGMDAVHALTDVTGFGLLGHLLEVCRASGATAVIDMDRVPLLPTARDLAQAGMVTGASGRNWAGYGGDVDLDAGVRDVDRALLTDPQTSGGLLVACAPDAQDAVLRVFTKQGFERAAVIGGIQAGPPRVRVQAGAA